MKDLILINLLFFSGILFSQNTKIEKKQIVPKEIDYKGSVKKITLKTFNLNKSSNKIDTTKTISEIYFSKQKKILKIKKYDKSLNNLWSINEFDNLERIKTISRKDGTKMFNSVIQYFSNNTQFPDSTIIDFKQNYKEKYINYFKDTLVIKQEHFVNDLLQDYRLYKYNLKNQLIEDLYLNPENNSDETLVSKSDNELAFYPERLTKYEYQIAKDTILITKISPKYSIKEITKKVQSKDNKSEVTEKYENEILTESTIIFTSKDSISNIHIRYRNKEIFSYYKTLTNLNSIITIWSSFPNDTEKTFTTKIETEYDKFKNWIKKTYSNDGNINYISERQIDYY